MTPALYGGSYIQQATRSKGSGLMSMEGMLTGGGGWVPRIIFAVAPAPDEALAGAGRCRGQDKL